MGPLALTGMTDKLSENQVSAQHLTRKEETRVTVLVVITWGATVQGISKWVESNRRDRPAEQANLCSDSQAATVQRMQQV